MGSSHEIHKGIRSLVQNGWVSLASLARLLNYTPQTLSTWHNTPKQIPTVRFGHTRRVQEDDAIAAIMRVAATHTSRGVHAQMALSLYRTTKAQQVRLLREDAEDADEEEY